MARPSIICVGPTGIGYFCEVPAMPVPDMGVVAGRHGALLVCDAPIVAFICARRSVGVVHLITNHLGSVACEADLVRSKLGPGVAIHADPEPYPGVPIDVVFIDRDHGTRSYVTTDYHPSGAHISSAVDQIRASASTESRTVLYVDIEAGTHSGRVALESAPLREEHGPSLWNVGGVADLSAAEDWLRDHILPEGAVIQVSLLSSDVGPSEMEATYGRVASSAGQTLVATLGGMGAAWTNGDSTGFVPSAPVPNGFTLAAGAVLSSSLVVSLADYGAADLGRAVSDAVEEATRYVRRATSGGEENELRLW